MKTFLILLKLRRAGFRFNREQETERSYILTDGVRNIRVPKHQVLDKFSAAEILREAGLLLVAIMLAGLSHLAPPAEPSDSGFAPSSTQHWLQ